MPMINRLLAAVLLIYGGYLTLFDGASPHSIVFMLVGISQLATDLIFPATETYDERQEDIKQKSGHMSYLLSMVYVFIMLTLVQWNVIDEIMTALLSVLFIQVLTFPIMMFIYNRRS
ncbi:hypothetical protein [Exiguobacterium sp. KRL4]|uniref:hypothetical protein n=1 Tax=Exiguobacterium sp. KRL4 TaxID=1914536 RepID=UPI001F3B06F6|nr:hypothetical protein [Exiguobacterium sp. KRL4]